MSRILLGLALFLLSFQVFAQSARSDELYAQAVDLYRAGKYGEAISLFQQVSDDDKQFLGEGHNRCNYATMWLASCYYKLGQVEKAKQISLEYYNLEPVDRRLTVESDSLAALAESYMMAGDFAHALLEVQKCAELERNVLGENTSVH